MVPDKKLKIILANPRGFCAGVERAIDIVERALQKFGAPIYVRHEIVHNRWVVEKLRAKGVIFVQELDEIPDGAITIFSAHGVAKKVTEQAKMRCLPVIDATCPLVTKVHNEAKRYEQSGAEIILIGHAGHPEVEGTMGRISGKVHLVATVDDVKKLNIPVGTKLAFVTQTTLSVDDTKEVVAELRQKFPDIQGPDVKDICYATQNRQNAVRALTAEADLLLVIGSQNSSNSNRLRDIGIEAGIASYLLNDASEFRQSWIQDDVHTIGITAGASAPELLVEELLKHISAIFPVEIEHMNTVEENIKFRLPPQLRSMA